MTYNEALEWIHGTYKLGAKLGLENIRYLLELMGDPHEKLKFVHVGGTNGKGSTASYISMVLSGAGFKTGLFTSPYIECFTERIKINGGEISGERLADIADSVKKFIDTMVKEGKNHPTEFEVVTAIALQYYYEEKCDIVVLEVGLGGRIDATNIISSPLVSVITNISFDHMNILGSTLEEIAYQKAGIIKQNCPVVLYKQSSEVTEVIRKKCAENNCGMIIPDFSKIAVTEVTLEGQIFDYGKYKNMQMQMLGKHQICNAVTAITTLEILDNIGYSIPLKALYSGIFNTKWPGRFEIMANGPCFVIDGAHNEDGVRQFVKTFCSLFPGRKATIIFGVLRDKEYNRMIRQLMVIADRFILITPNNHRAINAKDLENVIKGYCKNVQSSDTIKNAIEESLKSANKDSIICSLGSLYYIGEVRNYFKSCYSDQLRSNLYFGGKIDGYFGGIGSI